MDGTPIGKSISGPIAGIYMAFYEEELVFKSKNCNMKPLFWKRMRDDVFCIFQYGENKVDNFKEFLTKLNQEYNGHMKCRKTEC